MKTRGAVVREIPGKWEILDIDMEEPRQGEVRLKMVASGLCHSDDHMTTGDLPPGILPMAGGHEGAGIVAAVGPNTPGWEVGDHVVLSFLPGCGRCRWCASGMQNLCDLGANVLTGCRRATAASACPSTASRSARCAGISTFCEDTVVDVASCVKIDKDIPLEKVVPRRLRRRHRVGLGGQRGRGATRATPSSSWASAASGSTPCRAPRTPAPANVIAVDPVEFKREKAQELGATHSFATIDEATEFARSVTNGQGADSAIVTVGVLKTEHVGQAFAAIRKARHRRRHRRRQHGTRRCRVPAFELTLFQKRIQGALFGDVEPEPRHPVDARACTRAASSSSTS